MNAADPRTQRTHEMLNIAMRDVLREKRFSEITVQDVCQRAHLSRSTFYDHFRDKYDLFDQATFARWRVKFSHRVSIGASFNERDLYLLIVAAIEMLAQYRDTCVVDRDISPMPVRFELRIPLVLREIITGWLMQMPTEEEVKRKRIEASASLMGWAIFGAANDWYTGTRTCFPEESASNILPSIISLLNENC